jgi:predicted dehydrogenase
MIRVAIIGAGIGAEHLAGYRALPDRFAVATLCDLDTDRAMA